MPDLSSLLKKGIAGLALYAGLRYMPFFGQVSGHSMYPTIHEGDMIITNLVFLPPTRIGLDDIVVMEAYEENRRYIKRVVAVEGMVVPLCSGDSYRLKEGEYWLEGDNKCTSYDSRAFGPVPEDRITARVIKVLCDHDKEESPQAF